MNIRPVGKKMFRADGWIDRRTDGHDEDISRFSQFFERAKQWPEDSSNKRSERYLSFSRYCSLRTCRKKVTKWIFLWNLIYRCSPRVLITKQWKGYMWKPQLQMRICTIFLLTLFHSCSRMPHSRQVYAWFMHGGDPSYASMIKTYLNDKYLQRWAYLGESIVWPARSPDLNLLDFYLEGHSKLCILWQLMVKWNQNKCYNTGAR